MRSRPAIRGVALGAGLAIGLAVAATTDGGKGPGTMIAAPTPSASPSGVPVAEVEAYMAKVPNCEPKLFGSVPVSALPAAGIQGPSNLAVEMTVVKAPVTLHKLLLGLYQGKKLLWETEAQCGGCPQVYAVSDPPKGTPYYFQLDPAAVKVAAQLFPQATDVGLAGVVHDGALVRFRFVGLELQ